MINDKDYSIKDSAGEGGGGWVGERQWGTEGVAFIFSGYSRLGAYELAWPHVFIDRLDSVRLLAFLTSTV